MNQTEKQNHREENEMERVHEFDFCGDGYHVVWTGSVWVSPHNGQQHSSVSSAVTAELTHTIRASGDDPADYEDDIQDCIDEARGGELSPEIPSQMGMTADG